MCWICPICSTSNEDSTRICFVCGHERKRKRVPIEEIESSYEQGCAYYRNESYESAFELLNFAAEHRYVPALIKIAECYRLGRGTAISERKAYESYLSAAKKGDSFSQYEVAKCYYYGYGTSKNLARTVLWLEKAAEQNCLQAMKMLAVMLLDGEGVTQDIDRALDLFEEVSDLRYMDDEATDPDVLLGIGRCYKLAGRKIKAASYFKKAAKAGNAEAQYILAVCYLEGTGVFRSITKAKMWLERSVEKGHIKAYEKLSELD